MKRTITLAAVLLLVIGSASAVVGYNGSDRGLHIMSGDTTAASGSTAAGPNGTAWSVTVAMTGSSPSSPEDSVSNASFSYSSGEMFSASWEGEIVAPTPCHVIDHSVEKTGNSTYRLNVKTVRPESGNGTACAQVVTGISYDASFEARQPFRLEVLHSGEEVKTLVHPDYRKQDGSETDIGGVRGIIGSLLHWLAGLF
ncbi:MAG: hypothetical protein ABEJ66_00255 [Candidatus Nanohaloarchaea archaeon]